MFTYAHVLAACLYHYISVCLHMHQMQMINLKKGIYIYIYIPPEVHTLLPLSWPPHAHLCWCHARGRAWASRLCQNGGIWCWEPKIMRDGLEGCVLNSPQQLTHVHPVGPFFLRKKPQGWPSLPAMVLRRATTSFLLEEELRDLLTYECSITGKKRCPPYSLESRTSAKSSKFPSCKQYFFYSIWM